MKSKYIPTLLITSVIFAGISFLIKNLFPEFPVSPMLPYQILLIMGVTVLIHHLLIKSAAKNPTKFINVFMLSTLIRLLFYATVMVVYVFLFPEDAKRFILSFCLLYVVFTVFEVVNLLKILKNISPQKNKTQ